MIHCHQCQVVVTTTHDLLSCSSWAVPTLWAVQQPESLLVKSYL